MAERKRSRETMERDVCVKVPFMFISDDLIADILSRVGQKTLFRCKSVCKNWRALISDSTFMNRYITRLKTFPSLISGFYYGQKEYKITTILDIYRGTDAVLKFLECPQQVGLNDISVDTGLSFLQRKSSIIGLSFLQRKSSIIVVSSYNGFLLCAKNPGKPEKEIRYQGFYRFSYIICNPLTKQWIQLPKPHHSHYIELVHLLCYNEKGPDDLETDFKVISFVPAANQDFYVEIYTSDTGKWKSSRVPFQGIHMETCNVLHNGSVYFKEERNVYAYDLKEENLRSMGQPVEPYCWGHELLGVSAGSIYYAGEDRKFFRVWVLVDGIGWSMQHQIDYGSVYKQLPGMYDITYRSRTDKYYGFSFEPLAFHPSNPNVIFVNVIKWGTCGRETKILYHSDSKKVQVIGDLKHCNNTRVIPYSLPAWVPYMNTTLV